MVSKGVFTAVDVPNAAGTSLIGINHAGRAVGYWKDSVGEYHGLIVIP